MKNLFEKLKSENYTEYAIIIIITVFMSLIFADKLMYIFPDRGREVMFPAAILEGKIFYRDILNVYFPTAYYINALWMLLFGKSITVILLAGTVNCCIFAVVFYMLCREFLSLSVSRLLTLLIIVSCLFNPTLHNFVYPYAYSMTYGLSGYLLALLLIIKYFRCDKNIYLYSAFLSAGFAVACKFDFFPIVFILYFAILFLKRIGIKKVLFSSLFFTIFPLIMLSILLFQGLTQNDVIQVLEFLKSYASTDVIKLCQNNNGSLPCALTLVHDIKGIVLFTIFITVSYTVFFLTEKHKIFYIAALVILPFTLLLTQDTLHAAALPIILAFCILIRFRSLLKKQEILILALAGIGVSIRVFFALKIPLYGYYAMPILLLAALVMFDEYLSEPLKKLSIKKFIPFMLAVYTFCYFAANIIGLIQASEPVVTDRGKFYLPPAEGKILKEILTYVKSDTKKEDRLLVMPEGLIINFLADRPLDYSLAVPDKPYFDALGAAKTAQIIEKGDYNTIILIQGMGLSDFAAPFIYGYLNPVTAYITENFYLDKVIKDEDGKHTINIFRKRNLYIQTEQKQ